jgi:gliding motility-associated-like protein
MAQLSIIGTHIKLNQNGVRVIIFDSITSNTEIKYAGTNVRFYKYADALSNTNPAYPTLAPEDATGYIIKVDDIAKDTIWVIEYSKYKPELKSIKPDPATVSPCEELNLLIDATIPILSYQKPNGTAYNLIRNFKISYQNQEWTGTDWKNVDKSVKVILPATTYLLSEKLLADTKFILSGDKFADTLGIKIDSVTSDLYSAVAVECHPTTVISPRTELNEGERPTQSTSINFSAPIDIQFLSNANLPATTYYLWEIFKDGSTSALVSRIDKDQRYTFVESGTYKVKVTVGSTKCSYSDSITVTVSESALEVPIVFTPNGDGMNDEFRVAYKSLATFECWVFNRWGRQVFYWNDPQKGWNGKINGKDAPAGPYFYIIKAYGTDYNPKSKPDPKTKLRIGEHPRKGDINLLRGRAK